MPTSLYDLSVPTFLQTMRAMSGFLGRAASHFAQTGVDADAFVTTRLYPDMAPFHFQIEAAWHHAAWGVETLKTGAFTPRGLEGAIPFAALHAMIDRGIATLEAFTPEEIDACAGKALDLQIARAASPSRRSASFSPSRYPTSISTPSPPTTSCARTAFRSASGIMRDSCAPDRGEPSLNSPR